MLDVALVIALLLCVLGWFMERSRIRLNGPLISEVSISPPPKWKMILRVLATPQCWIQRYPYSAQWDRILRENLETRRFRRSDSDSATIGRWTVWTSNHPYGSMHPHNVDFEPGRPSRGMILHAGDRLRADLDLNSLDAQRLGGHVVRWGMDEDEIPVEVPQWAQQVAADTELRRVGGEVRVRYYDNH